MERVPLLVAVAGDLKGNRYQILEGEGMFLGRANDCEVAIPDQEVSRQHAKVTLHNAGIWVQDAGSRNGVFINGKRVVRPTELRPGGKLTIGPHEFILELAEVEDNDPSVIRPMRNLEGKSNPAKGKIIYIAAMILIIGIAAYFLFAK